mgnify:CR=1 FL=1
MIRARRQQQAHVDAARGEVRGGRFVQRHAGKQFALPEAIPVLRGEPILTHSPPPDAPVLHFGTLEVMTAFVFDVGVFLLVLGFAVTTMSLLARVEAREPR